jgi:glycine/D-amino acid oxidase-like deaminating enzyme
MDLTSGYPFWAVRNGLLQAYPALDTDLACDVVVLGGGVTGALIADRLVDAGLDVVVLDKREIGWGSTAGTTGLIQYELDTPLTELAAMLGASHAERAWLACLEAVHRLGALVDGLEDRCGFSPRQSVYLAGRRDRRLFEQEYEARRRLGLRVEWLDKRAVAAMVPGGRSVALLSHDAAQVDAYRLTHALLRRGVRQGLRVYDRSEVTAIDAGPSGVRARTARGCAVRARHLVFATGYESHAYLRKKVGRLVSTWALVSEPMPDPEAWAARPLVWEHADPYFYLRSTSDGRAMLGGEDEPFRNPALRDRLIGRKTKKLRQRFAQLYPETPMDVAFSWTGTFGVTDDGLGCIDQADEWPRCWFALCYGGNGITWGVLASEIIGDAILGRRNPHADLFRFDRPSA